jgi:hypothetical protein
VRTGTEQTSVPAVTSCSAFGAPCVTTCNGSRPATLSTVYCQVPAHSGPCRAVTADELPIRPFARRTAMTSSAPGRPLQLTAYPSGNPAEMDGDGSGAGRTPVRDGDSVGEGDATGDALGCAAVDGTGVQPASAVTATPDKTTCGHLIGTC